MATLANHQRGLRRMSEDIYYSVHSTDSRVPCCWFWETFEINAPSVIEPWSACVHTLTIDLQRYLQSSVGVAISNFFLIPYGSAVWTAFPRQNMGSVNKSIWKWFHPIFLRVMTRQYKLLNFWISMVSPAVRLMGGGHENEWNAKVWVWISSKNWGQN